MAYCAPLDVQTAAGGAQRLSQLVDWDGDAVVDAGEVTRAIEWASAYIDAASAAKYAVPLDPVTPRCRLLAADLAVYVLKKWRGVLTEADMEAHKADAAWLAQIGTGEAVWDADPEPSAAQRQRDAVIERGADKPMSRRASRGFW